MLLSSLKIKRGERSAPKDPLEVQTEHLHWQPVTAVSFLGDSYLVWYKDKRSRLAYLKIPNTKSAIDGCVLRKATNG